MNKKITKGLSLTFACLLGIGGLIGAIHASNNAEMQEVKAAVTNIYTHTFASGDFRTDRWWGVDGDVFWGDAMSSIESDGATFVASEYLRRFVYDNSSGVEIDNIYIPLHMTGDVTVKVMDDATSTKLLEQYYHNGDNAISISDLNTTAKKIAINVNRTSGSSNSNARVLYGETVIISRTSSFKISFNANGGSGGPSPVDVEQGSAMPTITTFPTKTGYSFAGYYDATSGGTKYYNANGSSAKNWDKAADTTLYAQWTANTYTIAYNGNKPSNATASVTDVPSSHSATYDANVTLGSAPKLTGWTFGGWYKETGCTNKVGNAGQTVSKPNLRSTSGTATLYAKWTANTYSVTYNANKPSDATSSVTNMPSGQTWTYDSDATLPSAPSLTGWTFGGWYKEAACTNKVGNAGQALTKPNLATSGNVNLYAKWTANTYTATYRGNKPAKAPASYNVTNIPASETWTYDSASQVTLGGAPSLTGYVFDGWYKEAGCVNKIGNAGQKVSKPNLTTVAGGTGYIYAKWVFNSEIQAVVNDINKTKTVSYDDLTNQIEIADTGYNDLDPLYQAVVDSEGYTQILNNAKAADAVGQMIEDLGPAQDTEAWRQQVQAVRVAYNALVDKTFIPNDTILKILVDDEAAIVVMDAINDIGTVHWNPTTKGLIDNAQNVYDAYIDAGHPHGQVANYNTLVQAHTDYNNVQTFVDKVNAITLNPFEYTDACKALIDEARRYFEEDMSEYQKGLATSDAASYYNLLVNYENAYHAMYLIDQINDMVDDPSCGEKIEAARSAVDALNPTTEMPLMNADLLKELEDKEAAWGVMELINAIYPMVYGEACEQAIQTARDAYTALTGDQKPLVVNYAELTKAEADYIAVKTVVVEVSNLGDIRHDEASLNKIESARNNYEALTNDQKGFYPADSLQTIVDYETAYEALNRIYNIGGVSYDSECETRIDEARYFYNNLTEEQKALIHQDDLQVLINAEASYAKLKKEATILVVLLLIVVCLAIAAGAWFLFLLLGKKRNKDDDENKGKKAPLKAMSVTGFLPLIMMSHYLDPSFLALYALAGIAVALWIAILVIFLVKKHKKANEADEEVVTVTDEQGNKFQIRYVKSFQAKLIQSSEDSKKYYEELKNEVLAYKGTSSRVSWNYDSINAGKNQVLKFGIRGKTLCVYLPLNVEEVDQNKYKVEKVESKKYEKVSCMYRIKNDRRLNYAKALIARVARKLHLEKGEEQHEKYANLPYEENKPLVARGLIKELKVQLNKAPEVEILEKKVNADGDEIIVEKDSQGNIFELRYIKSFTAKSSQAEEAVKDYYNELKNYALAYKDVNSRISWHYEAFSINKDIILKMAIRGKTLCLYFALDMNEVDPKYKVEEAKGKRFSDVKCLYRIKNDRRLAYAKELIDLLMKKNNLTKGDLKEKDFRIPFEETKALLEKGLIKEVKRKLGKKVEEEVQLHSITVEKADEMMSDEVAEEKIEVDTIHHHQKGKKEIVNIDVLSKHYNDDEEVTLESLKEKKLVSNQCGYVKVLARGILNKRLIVDLDDYSLQAVKMIVLLGGHAKKIK